MAKQGHGRSVCRYFAKPHRRMGKLYHAVPRFDISTYRAGRAELVRPALDGDVEVLYSRCACCSASSRWIWGTRNWKR
jgi:hypothetical protein